MKLLVPLKLSIVLSDAMIAPPWPPLYNIAVLPRKVVLPVNVRLLLRAEIPPPPTQELDPVQWLCVNSVFPARLTVVLITTSAVPRL